MAQLLAWPITHLSLTSIRRILWTVNALICWLNPQWHKRFTQTDGELRIRGFFVVKFCMDLEVAGPNSSKCPFLLEGSFFYNDCSYDRRWKGSFVLDLSYSSLYTLNTFLYTYLLVFVQNSEGLQGFGLLHWYYFYHIIFLLKKTKSWPSRRWSQPQKSKVAPDSSVLINPF